MQTAEKTEKDVSKESHSQEILTKVNEEYNTSVKSIQTALENIRALMRCFETHSAYKPKKKSDFMPIAGSKPALQLSGAAFYAQYFSRQSGISVCCTSLQDMRTAQVRKYIARFINFSKALQIPFERTKNGLSVALGGEQVGKTDTISLRSVHLSGSTKKNLPEVTQCLETLLKFLDLRIKIRIDGTTIIFEANGGKKLSIDMYSNFVIKLGDLFSALIKEPHITLALNNPAQIFPFPVHFSIETADLHLAQLLSLYMSQSVSIKDGFRAVLRTAEEISLTKICHPDMLAILWVAFVMSHFKGLKFILPDSILNPTKVKNSEKDAIDQIQRTNICLDAFIADFFGFLGSDSIDGMQLIMWWENSIRKFLPRAVSKDKAGQHLQVYHPFKVHNFSHNVTEAKYAEMKKICRDLSQLFGEDLESGSAEKSE